MNRENARKMLLDYINGNLGGEEQADLERFLDQDDELRLELEGIRREISILRGAIVDPLEEVHLHRISSDVMNELRRRRATGFAVLSLPLRSYLRAAIVVLLVLIGVVLFFILRPVMGGGTPERQEEIAAPSPR